MENLELPPLPPEDKFAKKIPVIKTYSTDIAETLKTKQGSVLSIAFAEEKKRQQIREVTSPVSKKNLTYIILGILFLGISAFLIGTFFISFFEKPTGILPNRKIPSIISYDFDKHIEISGLSNSTIQESIRKEIKNEFEGKIKRILLYQNINGQQIPLSIRELNEKLELIAPKKLINSLKNDFFSGIIKTDSGQYPVFIFSINSFDTAFSGMSEWESNMIEAFIFPFDIKAEGDNEILNRAFQDKTINNQPSRILIDKTAKIVLVYGFLGNDFVVITSNKDAFSEAISRLLRI